MPRRILYPFASSGDFREIPDADTTSSGAVTYQTGYGIDYQKRLDVESGAKNIDRSGFNGVLFDTTENIKSWQDQAFPDWYNPTGSVTDQGYKKKSVVRYTDGNLYVSKINNNRDLPTNSASWEYQYTTQEILATIPQIYRGVAPSSGNFQSSTFQMNGVWDFPTDAMVAGYANTPPGALAGYLTVKVTDGAGKGSFTYYDRTGQVFSMGYDVSLGTWATWNRKARANEVFLTNYSAVTTSTDWNTLTSSGSYIVSTANGPNSPGVNASGNLLVSASSIAGSTAQTFSYNDGTGKTAQYTRVFVGSAWLSWVFGSSDKVPFSGGAMTGALAMFNGSTAPTQGQVDNSTKVASTAFVKAASGNLVGFAGFTTRTLLPSDLGAALYATAPGQTITVPDAASLGFPDNSGRCVWFFGLNDSFTVVPSATVVIGYNVGGVPSITIKKGQSLILMATASNIWQVINSSADMFRNADFVNYFNEVATTQPRFDNTTKIATTEYVNRVGLSAANTVAITAGTYAFDATYSGKSVYNNGSGIAFVTLPSSASVKDGGRIEFVSITASISVAAPPGSNIYMGSGPVSPPIVLSPGDTLTVESNSQGSWIGVSGSAQLRYSADFAKYFTEVATTQVQFNNSTKIATTEFVQRALGNKANLVGMSASGTLAPSAAGTLVVFNAVNVAAVLPLTSAVPNGTAISFMSSNASGCTISRQGADKLVSGNSNLLTSMTVAVGDTATFVSSKNDGWYLSDGTMSLKYSGQFLLSNSGNNGYQKFPGDYINQWGSVSSDSSGKATVTFPTPFGVSPKCVNVTEINSGAGYATVTSITNTSFVVNFWTAAGVPAAAGILANWMAIGY